MTQTVTQPLVEVLVPMVEIDKGEREYRTFLRLLPELLVSHRGQYAAVHNGEVVDFDKDDIALIQRVHARFGYVPIHVGLVTDRPTRLRIPHYHEHQAADSLEVDQPV
jgi:hypothetical protein